MKTPEQVKEYRHNYYIQHKDYHYQKYRDWCNENQEGAAAIQKRWRDAHPHYYRDYMRKRKATTELLIFEFLDNGFGSHIDGYMIYLRNRGVPEKHINWFKVDVQKHLQKG
ncbi:unnamed protein product [marine sediment metagenome]|uniref:Uncharacterized protein n=1 Tax=marine sediment metagenome TaxID=412755 RepID=X1FWG1_9ZZZZ